MARTQISASFQYVSGGNLVPVAGGTVSIIDRDTSAPATVWSAFTGSGTISSLVTDAVGNVPGYLNEGSYAITVGAIGGFAGATLNWEAVRGDGVGNVASGVVGTSQLASGAVTFVELDPTTVGRNLVPVGTILDYAGTSAPAGFLMANGQVVSQATYPVLFSVCGTNYNTGGEGAGNFRLPDLRTRFALGQGTTSPYNTIGGRGGQANHTHSVPGHSHPLSANGGSLPGQQFEYAATSGSTLQFTGQAISTTPAGPSIPTTYFAYQIYLGGIQTTTGTATSTPTMQLFGNTDTIGAATTSTNDPPYMVVSKIIKCDVGT